MLRNQPSVACVAAAVAAVVVLSAAPARAVTMRTFVPETTDEVLHNPGMGVYLMSPPADSRPDEWYMRLADVAYWRLHWADVNPERGVYRFDEYFGPKFDLWVKRHGKRVALGVMSQSKHGRMKYVTPKWVFDAGVPGVTHKGLYVPEQINPVFWDERYLELHDEFIAKLGAYLNGKDGLEFVDMRGIGEWGEMHLQRWTSRQFEETGYTETKYVAAYRRMIDAFARAFPDTRVFLNVGGQNRHTINDYAALRGMHFRQDGLKPGGASYNCGEWLFKPYARRGVICNFEFHSGWDGALKRGWSPEATIDSCLAAPVSYLNTTSWFGGGSLRRAPQRARELLTRAGRKIGFRFVMTRLALPDEFGLDGARPTRVPLVSTWRNDGVAPCYESYALRWSLCDARGRAVTSALTFPQVPTTSWWPGQEAEARALLRVPADTRPGAYHLRVAMVLPETKRRIQLGFAGRDENDEYRLCEIRGARRRAERGAVHENGFERDAGGWTAAPGMVAERDARNAHGGGASLRVTGRQARGWNYASCAVEKALVPGGRYRLTVWMLVDRMTPGGNAPYVKIGVNDANGRWLDNYGSNRYDLSKLGTWQRLEVSADLPVNAAKAHLAIEKGAYETPITATMRIDDVELELLEGM